MLVTGGNDDSTPDFPPTATSEVYCTAVSALCATGDVGTFSNRSMATPRGSHTATLLADGTVLVAGGEVDILGN